MQFIISLLLSLGFFILKGLRVLYNQIFQSILFQFFPGFPCLEALSHSKLSYIDVHICFLWGIFSTHVQFILVYRYAVGI